MRTSSKKAAIAGLLLFAFVSEPVFAQLTIYPAEGQSAGQLQKDKFECYQWAQQQTGFDPQSAGVAAPGQGTPSTGPGRGAAKGAAAGAIGGAIGGNAGKGAAIGAGVGALGGGARRRQQEKEATQEQQQAQAAQQKKVANFNKAEATCLKGRGYSVS